ncbi:MAG: hypothetical protein QM756_04830 [Polyangiaceae bacterium]
MQTSFSNSVLLAIFYMTSDTLRVTRATLAQRLGVRTTQVEAQLEGLERRGLIDARQLRLTFPGLAVAASLRSRGVTIARAAA